MASNLNPIFVAQKFVLSSQTELMAGDSSPRGVVKLSLTPKIPSLPLSQSKGQDAIEDISGEDKGSPSSSMPGLKSAEGEGSRGVELFVLYP